jgi:Tat protein secretion system quality control protein TatD with DNase activity
LRDAIKTIANNRLVLETDCPFLCPMPNKKDINTPENIIIIHDYVTEILQKDITEQVVINACTFYDIEINEI